MEALVIRGLSKGQGCLALLLRRPQEAGVWACGQPFFHQIFWPKGLLPIDTWSQSSWRDFGQGWRPQLDMVLSSEPFIRGTALGGLFFTFRGQE